MPSGRFLRRGVLRAAFGAAAAAPFGASASAVAAVTGAAQEHVAVGAGAAVVAAAVLARRRDDPRLPLRVLAGAGLGVATRFVWPVAAKSPAEVVPHRAYTDLALGDDGAGVAVVANPKAGAGAVGGASPVFTPRRLDG